MGSSCTSTCRILSRTTRGSRVGMTWSRPRLPSPPRLIPPSKRNSTRNVSEYPTSPFFTRTHGERRTSLIGQDWMCTIGWFTSARNITFHWTSFLLLNSKISMACACCCSVGTTIRRKVKNTDSSSIKVSTSLFCTTLIRILTLVTMRMSLPQYSPPQLLLTMTRTPPTTMNTRPVTTISSIHLTMIFKQIVQTFPYPIACRHHLVSQR
uniref:Uncharacterized protein n=1 Tax=Cacopsylla melanoneura TaxID=428564 RepID=A0A8D9EAB1_9HEMI